MRRTLAAGVIRGRASRRQGVVFRTAVRVSRVVAESVSVPCPRSARRCRRRRQHVVAGVPSLSRRRRRESVGATAADRCRRRRRDRLSLPPNPFRVSAPAPPETLFAVPCRKLGPG